MTLVGVGDPAPEQDYAAAYRLLAQLRTMARSLAGGLDSTPLAEALLRDVERVAAYDRAAVLAPGTGGRLVTVASINAKGVDWDIDQGGENVFAAAWVSQAAQLRGSLSEQAAAGSALVLPLRMGLRTVGLLALESSTAGVYSPDLVAAVDQVARHAALRLATALLFDEVRAETTAQERRRLGRDIHDSIAQDLASLGYAVDGLADEAAASAPALAEDLRGLRQEISRMVGELRLTIFRLRGDVEQYAGLGAALSAYVSSVRATADLPVHLQVQESTERLSPDAESELLRIAQEAVHNARRHADAANLWVTLEVDPPRARLVVEDDGRGLAAPREGSYGLDIMRERAARLGGALTIAALKPSGTRVEVTIGPPIRRASRTDAPGSPGDAGRPTGS